MIDLKALRGMLFECRSVDDVVRICASSRRLGIPKSDIAELVSRLADLHFERYFILSQAANSERHQWDEAWPKPGAREASP